MDVLYPRVSADHVRLAREDENAQRLGVGIGAVSCGSEEDCGKEKFHAPELGTESLAVLSQMGAGTVKSSTRPQRPGKTFRWLLAWRMGSHLCRTTRAVRMWVREPQSQSLQAQLR